MPDGDDRAKGLSGGVPGVLGPSNVASSSDKRRHHAKLHIDGQRAELRCPRRAAKDKSRRPQGGRSIPSHGKRVSHGWPGVIAVSLGFSPIYRQRIRAVLQPEVWPRRHTRSAIDIRWLGCLGSLGRRGDIIARMVKQTLL